MRRVLLITLASLLALSILLPLSAVSVRADDLTPEQADHIKTDCVSIKNSLSQLHASDALLRVNRGQMYESIGTKLMDTFNARLASNQLDNKAMTTVTTSYRNILDTFRTDYIAYEQKLADTIRIDCTVQPNTFHNSLLKARQLRQTVHDDVVRLGNAIDDYRSSVNGFLLNYERVSQ